MGDVNGMTGYSWPTTTISHSALVSFMELFLKRNYYSITFSGISGEILLMNSFYNCQMYSGKDDLRTNFSITFTREQLSG